MRLGCLSAPSADFSDDDIEDRRIEEEDLEDTSPAEPERRGWFGGLRGYSVTPPRPRNRRESFVFKYQLKPRPYQKPRKVKADPSHVDVVKALVRAYFSVCAVRKSTASFLDERPPRTSTSSSRRSYRRRRRRVGGVGRLKLISTQVVRKTFCDLVPKIVMTHVVHKVRCCVGIN